MEWEYLTVGQVHGDVILQSVPAGNDFSTVLLKEAFVKEDMEDPVETYRYLPQVY